MYSAYSKNDPINYCDPDGFARIRIMDEAGHYCYDWDGPVYSCPSSSSGGNAVISKSSAGGSAGKTVFSTIKESTLASVSYVSKQLSKSMTVDIRQAKFIPKLMKNQIKGVSPYITIPGSSLAKYIGRSVSIFGVLWTLYDDVDGSKSWQECGLKIGYDSVVMGIASLCETIPYAGIPIAIGVSVAGGVKRKDFIGYE